MTGLDMLAETFKQAAKRDLAASQLYPTLALRIAGDADLLRVAGKANPGLFPPLLFFAAVHTLVLESTDAALAQFFPTVTRKPVPKTDPYPAFRDFVLAQSERIVALIQSAHVNKSVIKRSACLRALLVKVSMEKAWERVHLVDIGCSAGLNLLMDHWRITYQGAGSVGPADASVRFSIDLDGDVIPPLGDPPDFLSRTGIDLDSFDFSNEAHERWLLGGLIPDQLDTYDATKSALPLLRQNGPRIITGDASVVLPDVIAGLPGNDPVVVMHSFTLHQMKPNQRQSVFRAIQQASTTRPVARIGMELSKRTSFLSIAKSPDDEPMTVGEADDDAAWMRWY